MFAYAYLAMTAYNIVQPLTRSKLIDSLGAVNVPYVIFANGLLIGVLMLGYTRLFSIASAAGGRPDHPGRHGVIMFVFWVCSDRGGLGFWSCSTSGRDPRHPSDQSVWTLATASTTRDKPSVVRLRRRRHHARRYAAPGLTAFIIERVGANALLLGERAGARALRPLAAIILGREAASVTG